MISESMGEKSLVNTIGIFGPETYHYLSYGILFFVIICIILLETIYNIVSRRRLYTLVSTHCWSTMAHQHTTSSAP